MKMIPVDTAPGLIKEIDNMLRKHYRAVEGGTTTYLQKAVFYCPVCRGDDFVLRPNNGVYECVKCGNLMISVKKSVEE